MDDIAILYNSKTGFTKKYADELGRRIGSPALPWKQAIKAKKQTDYIVFGSRLHAGRIESLRPALRYLSSSGISKIFVFVTGAMPKPTPEKLTEIWQNNFTADELQRIPCFYLPGGLCYEKMGLGDRLLMAGLRSALRSSKDAEQQAMLSSIQNSYDLTDLSYLDPLENALRNICRGD